MQLAQNRSFHRFGWLILWTEIPHLVSGRFFFDTADRRLCGNLSLRHWYSYVYIHSSCFNDMHLLKKILNYSSEECKCFFEIPLVALFFPFQFPAAAFLPPLTKWASSGVFVWDSGDRKPEPFLFDSMLTYYAPAKYLSWYFAGVSPYHEKFPRKLPVHFAWIDAPPHSFDFHSLHPHFRYLLLGHFCWRKNSSAHARVSCAGPQIFETSNAIIDIWRFYYSRTW